MNDLVQPYIVFYPYNQLLPTIHQALEAEVSQCTDAFIYIDACLHIGKEEHRVTFNPVRSLVIPPDPTNSGEGSLKIHFKQLLDMNQ